MVLPSQCVLLCLFLFQLTIANKEEQKIGFQVLISNLADSKNEIFGFIVDRYDACSRQLSLEQNLKRKSVWEQLNQYMKVIWSIPRSFVSDTSRMRFV